MRMVVLHRRDGVIGSCDPLPFDRVGDHVRVPGAGVVMIVPHAGAPAVLVMDAFAERLPGWMTDA